MVKLIHFFKEKIHFLNENISNIDCRKQHFSAMYVMFFKLCFIINVKYL
jgi:hypothetical protein